MFAVKDHCHLFVDSKRGKELGEERLCGLVMLHVHRDMNV